jgi:pimeloyl-ACP methyl ester carboxylesterase
VNVVDHVTSRDGTSIAFEQDGEGPPLILVDAATGFRGFGPMGELARLLAPDFRVITYDRRGRGESTDIEPYAVDREVEDIEALIDAAGAGEVFAHGFSSGAVLAMFAAARGLPISRLTALEPPLELDRDAMQPDPLELEIADLVAAGRGGDAVEHFNRSIGVPEEYLVGMRDAPFWPALEALAHTLVYDATITRSMSRAILATIPTPTLVINSAATDDRLRGWARDAAATMPNASHRELPGEWHGVANDVLAPALKEFFLGRSSAA